MERLIDRARFARAVLARPRGRRARDGALLVLAPQGRYLNAGSGVHGGAFPEAYLAQRDTGAERARSAASRRGSHSEYLAFSSPRGAGVAVRLWPICDRARVPGIQGLFRLRAGQTRSFVLGWRRAPPGASAATPLADIANWPEIPETASGRDFAGFVEPDSAAPGACSGAGRVLASGSSVAATSTRHFEFAPFGTGRLWIDGQLAVTVPEAQHAVLGQGALLSATLSPGAHSFVVEVCPPPG